MCPSSGAGNSRQSAQYSREGSHLEDPRRNVPRQDGPFRECPLEILHPSFCQQPLIGYRNASTHVGSRNNKSADGTSRTDMDRESRPVQRRPEDGSESMTGGRCGIHSSGRREGLGSAALTGGPQPPAICFRCWRELDLLGLGNRGQESFLSPTLTEVNDPIPANRAPCGLSGRAHPRRVGEQV